jgi:branched-chain amino acid aminotransferase
MTECLGKVFIRNGQLLPSESFDPCFLSNPFYIYEVFRVIDGVPLFLEDHEARLRLTASLSDVSEDLIPPSLAAQVKQVIAVNQLETGNMKIVVHDHPTEGCATVFLIYITEHQYPTTAQFEQGVPVALFEGIRTNPNAKVMDVVLRNKTNLVKSEQEVYETLLVDKDNCITEGSRSNVFFVKGKQLITPPLEDVLPGVTRKHIIELCHRNGIPLSEEKVPIDAISLMDGAFISGTSRKVLPVRSINGHHYSVGLPLIRQLQQLFQQEVDAYVEKRK